MGVAFKDLINSEEINLDFLKDKIILLDAYNILYQFLTTIRGRDGSLLMDSQGNVTSHFTGLFSRTSNFVQKGIKVAYVFDGVAPNLKQKEREKRKAVKLDAEKKYQEAKKREDVDGMRKYASRTTRLTKDLVDEAKELISYFGIPVIQAPSEGEAQAAYMVSKGHGFAVGSQDFDSLVHGATKLVRNLSITGRRKKGKSVGTRIIKPEIISLSDNLNNLGIDQNQLIVLAMLIGTDYNPGGIKGIGPKNALKLVKQHRGGFDKLFKEVKWKDHFDFDWNEVYYLIKKIPTTDNYELEWKDIDVGKIKELLVEKHNFSEERINLTLDKLTKNKDIKNQKGLSDYF
tara:strand:+ start:3695 stop:4729 length:1035 start_codon:yes stop_codon:yes gene_type:complete